MSKFAFLEEVTIKRVGSVDQVAQLLRQMIADGRLPQGEHLPEIPMSKALGVSRNTFRDAVRLLATEGLISHELHRGAEVRVLSPDDVSEIYEVRRYFELKALAAVPKSSQADRKRVKDALRACKESFEDGDYGSFVEHELEYHAALVAHLGNSRFDHFFSQIIGEQRLLFSELSSDSEPRATKRLVNLYRKVYRTAEQGNVKEAQKLLGESLSSYEERLRTQVAAREAGSGKARGKKAASAVSAN